MYFTTIKKKKIMVPVPSGLQPLGEAEQEGGVSIIGLQTKDRLMLRVAHITKKLIQDVGHYAISSNA